MSVFSSVCSGAVLMELFKLLLKAHADNESWVKLLLIVSLTGGMSQCFRHLPNNFRKKRRHLISPLSFFIQISCVFLRWLSSAALWVRKTLVKGQKEAWCVLRTAGSYHTAKHSLKSRGSHYENSRFMPTASCGSSIPGASEMPRLSQYKNLLYRNVSQSSSSSAVSSTGASRAVAKSKIPCTTYPNVLLGQDLRMCNLWWVSESLLPAWPLWELQILIPAQEVLG